MSVSVLIVDDSALMRGLIGQIVEKTPGLCIADKAMNGRFALEKIPRCNPDIIVLDIEMPEMNGVEFLKERKRLGIKIPVIILSTLSKSGTQITMECLQLGASDFVTKPNVSGSQDLQTVAKQLGTALLTYGERYQRTKATVDGTHSATSTQTLGTTVHQQLESIRNDLASLHPLHSSASSSAEQNLHANSLNPSNGVYTPPPKKSNVVPARKTGIIEIIAIGISTGGPNALRSVFAELPATLKQPILVVQHMPAGFTEEFANSLNRICPLTVKQADEGDVVTPSTIYIAPGDAHICIEKQVTQTVIHLSDEPLRNGHRPSADVLFESVAKHYRNHALGVIMTGMGRDGCDGLGKMYAEGAATIGQDEPSSIVYGMPKVAYEMGFVQKQFPLEKMAEAIVQTANAFTD